MASEASKDRLLVERVNGIILEGKNREMLFSNLQLQKLLYLSYGIHLKNDGEILDYLPFQAWTHGPVVPDVYHYYDGRGFLGRHVIDEMMIYDNEYPECPLLLNDKSISKAVERYGNVAPFELVNLTHQRGGAWHGAFLLKQRLKHETHIDHHAIKKEFSGDS